MSTAPQTLVSLQMGKRECPICTGDEPVAHYHAHNDGTLGLYVPSASRLYGGDVLFRFHWHQVRITNDCRFACSCEHGQVVNERGGQGDCQHTDIRYQMDRLGLDLGELVRNGSRWALVLGNGEEL